VGVLSPHNNPNENRSRLGAPIIPQIIGACQGFADWLLLSIP
jgi:hypothetical protein